MNVSNDKQKIVNNYFEEFYDNKINPKINKRALKGLSSLTFIMFMSQHSAIKFGEYLEKLGYNVDVHLVIFVKIFIIKW